MRVSPVQVRLCPFVSHSTLRCAAKVRPRGFGQGPTTALHRHAIPFLSRCVKDLDLSSVADIRSLIDCATTPLRYAIVGNSGSGKSTLATLLARNSAAPILDLDTIAWLPQCGGSPQRRPTADVAPTICSFCEQHAQWIVEGCYGDLIALTLERNPILIFLDRSIEVCVDHCLRRPWEPHKFSTAQEQEQMLPHLIEWVRAYRTRPTDDGREAHLRLFQQYSGPKHHIRD